MRTIFTQRFSRVLDRAAASARQFNHEHVGTEHLLMGYHIS